MKNHLAIHYRYVILMLTLIIICLLTFRYAPDTQLFNYVSFAGTILSSILAILAIIYAIYSNNSFSSTISTLDKSSSEIKTSSIEIKNNTERLNSLIDVLKKQYETIPKMLSDISSKIDAQSINISEVPKQKGDEKQKNYLTKDFISIYVSNSPNTAILGLYAIAKSFDIKKNFKLDDITPESTVINSDYLFGYFMATKSIGIINVNAIDSEWTVIESKLDLQYLIEKSESIVNQYKNTSFENDITSFKNKIDIFFK